MRRLAPWVAFLACALACGPAAGESELFAPFELEFTGKLRAHAISDLDGDGLRDIGVLLSLEDEPASLRFLSCLQSAEGGFPGSCSSIQVPAATRVFDVGDIDGVPGAELVILTDEGLRATSPVSRVFAGFTPLLRQATIFAGTEPGKPARLRFLWDIDGDSRKELLLPTIAGPRILRYSSSELALLEQIDSPAEISYRVGDRDSDDVNGSLHVYAAATEARFVAPQTLIEDFDGDGRVDVMTLQGNRLRVFLQGPSGRFPAAPSLDWERSILDPDEREDPHAHEAVTFKDLDGDGASDIIAMKWGLPSKRTLIDRYIYYARSGLEYPEEPDQRIRSESVDRRVMVSDLNRDGRQDLIVPFFHFAAAQAVRVVAQNALKVQFRLFLMREDGRYGQDADKAFARVDRRVGLSYHIDILGYAFGDKAIPEEGVNPLISFNADANGDGYPDLVADTGADRLAFYWGNSSARYAGSPDHTVQHESALDFDLVDLNGDGKTDVVTYHAPRDRAATPPRRGAQAPGASAPPQAPQRVSRPRGPTVKILLSR